MTGLGEVRAGYTVKATAAASRIETYSSATVAFQKNSDLGEPRVCSLGLGPTWSSRRGNQTRGFRTFGNRQV